MIEVQIDFPPAPKISDRPEKQQEFERWLEQYNTCIIRQFEQIAAEVDRKQDST